MYFCILYNLFVFVLSDIKKQEKIDLEEKAEMSKNAQFRAIQPSPSILSYVEDNVICMRPSDVCPL